MGNSSLVGQAVVLFALLASGPVAAASFTPLGYLTGWGNIDGFAELAISADGNVIVGANSSPRAEAFRWTAATGSVPIGFAGGRTESWARSVSADGSVIVGFGPAFRWTATDGMGVLPPPAGGTCGTANAVSANGSRAAGECLSASQQSTAVYWPTPDTAVDLGALPGEEISRADGISADGSVVVGSSLGVGGWQAFRWTAGDGMTGLGVLPGYTGSFATGVSGNGATVIGDLSNLAGSQAFRWSAGTGMEGLGSILGEDNASKAMGVSTDGSVIVGSVRRIGSYQDDAFIWTPEQGMQRLLDVLVAAGVSGLEGWNLREATGISADGLRIVGLGQGPESEYDEVFLVDLTPVPAPPAIALLLTAVGTLAARARYRRPSTR